jgi:hypothetical protein
MKELQADARDLIKKLKNEHKGPQTDAMDGLWSAFYEIKAEFEVAKEIMFPSSQQF